MTHIRLLLLAFVALPAFSPQQTVSKELHQTLLQAPVFAQDDDEISYLLRQLYDRVVIDDSVTRIDSPSREDQNEICRRLIRIADESKEARSRVVQNLIGELKKPEAREGLGIAIPWLNVVSVLGKLKAVEAIDTLVRNICYTGQNGIIISIHFRPTLSAVVRIGEAAIPRLIEEVLSDHNSCNRTEAAWALV